VTDLVPSVLYCRPDVPPLPARQEVLKYEELRLLPSHRDELVRATSPVVGVTKIFHAKTAEQMATMQLPDEWEIALGVAKTKSARLAVYRIEHLARMKDIPERLRALVDLQVPLYVHANWPFESTKPELLKQLAQWSEMLARLRERDRAVEIRDGLKDAVAQGTRLGPPRRCTCGHERSDHDGGVGMCSQAACACIAYSPPV